MNNSNQRAPDMKKRPLVISTIIVLLILLAMVLFPMWDFGGLYWRDYYNNIDYHAYLYFDHIISGPFMACVMLLFFTTLILMLVSLISRKVGSKNGPYIAGIVLMSIVFSICLTGAIAVAIVGETGDYNDWWYDGACWVGNIAPILIIIFLIFALVRVSVWRKELADED